mmetsp:Transcript_21477/g.60472  ORF Transcript_21477/g.60472 Transcript_21477/m.60472 type:complete len:244 (-) Transcript_21477:216-947(-)
MLSLRSVMTTLSCAPCASIAWPSKWTTLRFRATARVADRAEKVSWVSLKSSPKVHLRPGFFCSTSISRRISLSTNAVARPRRSRIFCRSALCSFSFFSCKDCCHRFAIPPDFFGARVAPEDAGAVLTGFGAPRLPPPAARSTCDVVRPDLGDFFTSIPSMSSELRLPWISVRSMPILLCRFRRGATDGAGAAFAVVGVALATVRVGAGFAAAGAGLAAPVLFFFQAGIVPALFGAAATAACFF